MHVFYYSGAMHKLWERKQQRLSLRNVCWLRGNQRLIWERMEEIMEKGRENFMRSVTLQC